MTGEEMERAIEFLLKNQAAFDARHAAFKVEQEKTTQQIRELAARDQQTREFLDELSQIVAQNSQDIARNSQDIAQNSQLIKHINNILRNVVEGQNRHEEEIDALIKLVGGVIERGNGQAES